MAAHDDGSRAVEGSEQPVDRPDPSEDTPDLEAVYDRLDRVDDPELDRSIVELEYIERVTVDGGRVEVGFVLPTAWCSPAFAWMMATGIRHEVGSLPEVETVRVDLREHMHGEEIVRGVNEGLPFEEAFEDAEDGIEAVPLRDGAVTVTLPAEPLTDYLEKARATGLLTEDDGRLFADRDGEPFEASEFEDVRRQSRVAAANITGQGAICSALHEARNGVAADD